MPEHMPTGIESSKQQTPRGQTLAKRDTVLRVLTDLFLHNGAQQSPAERSMQEELMFNLLSEAGIVMRQEVAERLAAHANPPPRVVQLLARDDIAVSRPVLMNCPGFDDDFLSETVRRTTNDHARAIAQRPHIGPMTVDALLQTGDRETLLAMAANPNTAFSENGIDILAATALKDDRIAESLLHRQDMRSDVLMGLFWHARSHQRERIVEQLSERNNGMGPWINQIAPLSAPIARGGEKDRMSVHRGLVSMLMNRRMVDFQTFFAKVLGIRLSLMQRVMADEQGEPFAVVCKAGGFSQEAFTTLVLLYNPAVSASVNRVFALGQLYKGLHVALCWRMLQAWNAIDAAQQPAGTFAAHQAVAMRAERPRRGARGEAATGGAAHPATAFGEKRSA